MTDNTEDAIDVQMLSTTDLDKLSNEQVRYVHDAYLRRTNPRISDIVRGALKNEKEAIITGLSRPPFTYVTPEIELLAGLKVKFKSLFSFQTDDVTMRVQDFMRTKKATEMLGAQHMNKLFLAHGIDSINGEPLGGVMLAGDIWKSPNSESVSKAVDSFVVKRMTELDCMPQSLVSALISANQVFQGFYDDIVNLRGDYDTVLDRAEGIVESVGKSTGPQLAGQKPT